MVQEAIVTLKEMTGSCQYAIQKFIAKKQKTLMSNFRKLLLFHLKKFVAVDKFVNVKNSAVSLVLTMMFYGFKEIFTYTLSSFFLKLKSLVKMHLLILDCLSILILFKVIGNSVALNSSYGSAEEVACDSDSVSSGSDSFLTRGLVMVFGYECVHIQKITEASGTEEAEIESETSKIAVLLRRFLQRRAQAYARLKMGFEDYMVSGVESTYQKLCSKIAVEFNDCSKQVLEMESQILSPDCFREDLVVLLRFVQTQECKLNLTDTIRGDLKSPSPSKALIASTNSPLSGMPSPTRTTNVSVTTMTNNLSSPPLMLSFAAKVRKENERVAKFFENDLEKVGECQTALMQAC
nr:uncharacterized protein LOC109154124 [Ipomoea batatas]